MRRSLTIASGLLVTVLVGTAFAGSWTVTTNALNDSRISRMRAYGNARAWRGAPWATDNAFVDFQCGEKIRDLWRDVQTQPDDTFENAWDTANTTTRDSICSTLGLAAGCKP